MTVQKPVARVDLAGEIKLALHAKSQGELREVIGFGNSFGQLERKEMKPDLGGAPVDLVHVGEQRADRALPGRGVVLFEK
jgi:hypothetical protein